MKKIAQIGSLLKKIYRIYSSEIIRGLEDRGFADLRPSFLEILIYLSEEDSPSIKKIGVACGLKKQTMTSHLNELEKRGYIQRELSQTDKREQMIYLSDFGNKFKINLLQVINDIEERYVKKVGEVELKRMEHMLSKLHEDILDTKHQGTLI